MRRHYNGEVIDTSDVVIGSGGDTAIDSIAIIVNGSIVTDVESLADHADLSGNFDVAFVFVQAERSSRSTARRSEVLDLGCGTFSSHNPGWPEMSGFSRDSRLGQRNDCTLAVQVFDCLVNGAIESGDVSEGLMSQIVRL